MNRSGWTERTIDPGIGIKPVGGGTSISSREEIRTETRESELFTLTECVQTLVNQYGQLRTEVQERPKQTLCQINDLGEAEYSLKQTLLIPVEEYEAEENFVARYPELELIGEGPTEAEAILNLRIAILDLFDELHEEDANDLGALPLSWLRILDNLVEKAE